MKRAMLLLTALVISATLPTTGQAARYPLNTWRVGCNPFWGVCVKRYHTGCDAAASAGTPVYAPIAGIIKEARTHGGYGGTIIIEGSAGGETVTIILGHMRAASFAVHVGTAASPTRVAEGQYLGVLGNYYENGGWSEHSHLGWHRYAYRSFSGVCGDPTAWVYHGYSPGCDYSDWENPMLAIPFANKFNQLGGASKLGSPQGNFQWSGSADYRVYNGGSYGECIIVNTSTGPWLVRTGFYQKYMAIGATNSWLGLPTSDEYVYLCTTTCNLARQNFKNGYMIWDCSGVVKVYNNRGARVSGLEPTTDESSVVMPMLSLAISPNPTRQSPSIRFSLPQAGDVTIGVYDLAGRKVASLITGQQPAGEQTVTWARMADNGSRVRAGIYFVRLTTPTHTLTRQVVTLE